MAFFNEFPHTRTYDSDLGWLISEYKKVSGNYDSLVSWISVHEIEYNNLKKTVDTLTANMLNIIDPWDGTKEYSIYTIVSYDGVNYIALKDVPAGVLITNTEYWSEANTVINQVNAISASVSELLNSLYVYTPEKYGAIGDGVADDSTAFTLAVNACITNGYKLYLRNKTYKIHDVVIPGNLEIIGGTLKPDIVNDLTNQYKNLLTATNCNITFKNVHFTGVGAALLDTPIMYHYMKFTNCELIFHGCEWDNIYTLNTNLATVPFIDRFGVLLTAIDSQVQIIDCYIHDLGREEQIWICPTTDNAKNILFANNKIENVRGWSFNLFGDDVKIHHNYITGYKSNTSIFNIHAVTFTATENIIVNTDCMDVFDTEEHGYMYADSITVENNYYRDDGSYNALLLSARGRNIICRNNNCIIRALINISNGYSADAPNVIPWANVENFDSNMVEISGNIIEAHITGNTAVLPIIQILASRYYEEFGSGNLNFAIVKNNYIGYKTTTAQGTFRYIAIFFSESIKKIAIENNTIEGISSNTFSGSRLFPIAERYTTAKTIEEVSIINNYFAPVAAYASRQINELFIYYDTNFSPAAGVAIKTAIFGYNIADNLGTYSVNPNATITNNLRIQTS